MTAPVIVPVATSRQQRQFLEIPWALYRHDPHWVPPLRNVQRALVGFREHPFYRTNQIQTFLALRDGVACGRVAAILNQSHNDYHGEQVGFFGFFECVEDQAVAAGLLDAVREWFRARGVQTTRGPVNPSLEYTAGLLVEGFDSPPTFQMAYNPPYYPRLIEGCGFQKSQDLLAYRAHVGMLEDRNNKLSRLREFSEQVIQRYQVHVRPLRLGRLSGEIDELVAIYNRSMSNQWGFLPMTRAELLRQVRYLRILSVPEFALGAEINGQLVGFAIGLPDYNPAIRQIDGRLFPFGFLRVWRQKRHMKRLHIVATNVVPEYQRMGLAIVLLCDMVPTILKRKIVEVEYSWIMESNPRSFENLEKGGAELVKRFRIYDRTS